jgi:hypothetical protein
VICFALLVACCLLAAVAATTGRCPFNSGMMGDSAPLRCGQGNSEMIELKDSDFRNR